jgi:hypothetical protein
VERWGDRTLDLDIVAIDDLRLDTGTLVVPHPRAAERAFVLAPWLDADPDAVHPTRGPVRALLADLGDDTVAVDTPRLFAPQRAPAAAPGGTAAAPSGTARPAAAAAPDATPGLPSDPDHPATGGDS